MGASHSAPTWEARSYLGRSDSRLAALIELDDDRGAPGALRWSTPRQERGLRDPDELHLLGSPHPEPCATARI